MPTEWAQAKAREWYCRTWPGAPQDCIDSDCSSLAALIDSVRGEATTYCPECGTSGECACIGNLREQLAEARAEVERLNRIINTNRCLTELAKLYYEIETLGDRVQAALGERDKAEAKLAKVVEALRRLLGYVKQLELVAYDPDDIDVHDIVAGANAALAAAK